MGNPGVNLVEKLGFLPRAPSHLFAQVATVIA